MNRDVATTTQHHVIRKLMRHPSAVIGASIIFFFLIIAIFAPLLATHEPMIAEVQDRLARSSYDHFLGTDGTGRDIYSRILYGARISLKVGLIAMTFSLGLGTLFGAFAGYYGGWLDNVIMRIMDMMLAMPSILLAMVIVTILGQSLTNAIISLFLLFIFPNMQGYYGRPFLRYVS